MIWITCSIEPKTEWEEQYEKQEGGKKKPTSKKVGILSYFFSPSFSSFAFGFAFWKKELFGMPTCIWNTLSPPSETARPELGGGGGCSHLAGRPRVATQAGAGGTPPQRAALRLAGDRRLSELYFLVTMSFYRVAVSPMAYVSEYRL